MQSHRRLRTRCRLPCEIEQGRARHRAAVVTLSEGGLAVETALELAQGDAARIRIHPQRGERAVVVDAIAWNLHRVRAKQVLGFVLSDVTPAFLALLAAATGGSPARDPEPRRRPPPPASPSCNVVVEAPADPSLPRPRDPLVPEKADEELPLFRVRVKQRAGPRTRSLALRALSQRDAAAAALAQCDGAWDVLEVAQA